MDQRLRTGVTVGLIANGEAMVTDVPGAKMAKVPLALVTKVEPKVMLVAVVRSLVLGV